MALLKKVKFHSSVIIVQNIEISRYFYQDILDQIVTLDFGKNIIFECGLALWELRNTHIIPQKINNARIQNDSNRFELYFEYEDIEEIKQRLVDHSVRLLHDIHEEPWGQRTIRFFDPDGHLIEVGEPLDAFILRMLKEGMTVHEVHQKSSVPVDLIEKIKENTVY